MQNGFACGGKMLTKVEVTQADISNGVMLECTMCPVALAINRHLNPVFQSSVRPGYIILRSKFVKMLTEQYTDSEIIPTEKTVHDFIHAFDMHGYVQPFSFELDIPDNYLAQGVA